MTDRVKGFIVTLDISYREDDIEPLRKAICHFSGVVDVSPSKDRPEDWINRARIRHELQEKLREVLKEEE